MKTLVKALLAGAVALTPGLTNAATVEFSYVAAGTAVDNGPQDGAFDFLVGGDSLGQVDDNGFTDTRTAMEFDLSSIPSGATILSASLALVMNAEEGPRAIQLHGYVGDGAISLGDFSQNLPLGLQVIGPGFSIPVVFDTAAYIAAVLDNGGTFAGFNLREEPPNASGFTIADVVMTGAAQPVLSVTFVPVPGAVGLLLSALGTLALTTRKSRSASR